MGQAGLIAVATWCEQNNTPFYLQIGTPAGLIAPIGWLASILDAAPTKCMGLYIGETPIENYSDGISNTITILETLRTRGKKLCYHRMTNYWEALTMDSTKLNTIFASTYNNTIVPLYENLEPSCEGRGLGVVLGLWHSDRVKNWGISAQSWGWQNMCWGGTNDMPAHLWNRMFMITIGMGANYLQIEPDWSMFSDNLRSLQQFATLVSVDCAKTSPGPGYSPGTSNISLELQPVSCQPTQNTNEPLLYKAAWDYRDRSTLLQDTEFFRSIYKAGHVYESLFPTTSYGIVPIIPPNTTPRSGTSKIVVNEYGMLSGSTWLPATQSLPSIITSYLGASWKFRAAGCFVGASRLANKDYLVFLVDSEARFPAKVTTTLNVTSSLGFTWRALDAMTGAVLTKSGNTVPNIAIPAGGFRLVRIKP